MPMQEFKQMVESKQLDYKDLEIRHLFFSLAETTMTRPKVLTWATLALISTL